MQAHQLWSSTSDAFCFSAGAASLDSIAGERDIDDSSAALTPDSLTQMRGLSHAVPLLNDGMSAMISTGTLPAGQDGAREAGDVSIFVQPVPQWTSANVSAQALTSSAGPARGSAGAESADVHVELPLPVEVTSGSLAWWSPT